MLCRFSCCTRARTRRLHSGVVTLCTMGAGRRIYPEQTASRAPQARCPHTALCVWPMLCTLTVSQRGHATIHASEPLCISTRSTGTASANPRAASEWKLPCIVVCPRWAQHQQSRCFFVCRAHTARILYKNEHARTIRAPPPVPDVLLNGSICIGVFAHGSGCCYSKPFISPFNQNPSAVADMFAREMSVSEFVYKLSEHMPRWMRPAPLQRTYPCTWKLYVVEVSDHPWTHTEKYKEIAPDFRVLDLSDTILSNSRYTLAVSMTPEYETGRGIVTPGVATVDDIAAAGIRTVQWMKRNGHPVSCGGRKHTGPALGPHSAYRRE